MYNKKKKDELTIFQLRAIKNCSRYYLFISFTFFLLLFCIYLVRNWVFNFTEFNSKLFETFNLFFRSHFNKLNKEEKNGNSVFFWMDRIFIETRIDCPPEFIPSNFVQSKHCFWTTHFLDHPFLDHPICSKH